MEDIYFYIDLYNQGLITIEDIYQLEDCLCYEILEELDL